MATTLSPPFLSAEADQCWQRCPAAARLDVSYRQTRPKASLSSSEASCTPPRRTVFLQLNRKPENRSGTTQVALRGLAYWPGDKTTHPRVFAGIKGGMIASDAVTGKPAPGFASEIWPMLEYLFSHHRRYIRTS